MKVRIKCRKGCGLFETEVREDSYLIGYGAMCPKCCSMYRLRGDKIVTARLTGQGSRSIGCRY